MDGSLSGGSQRRRGGYPAAAKASIKNPPQILTEVAIKRTDGAISFYEKDIFVLSEESPHISLLAKPCKQAVESLREYKRFLEKEVSG